MGYRTYLARIDKKLIDEIHNCKTKEELNNIAENHKLETYSYGKICPWGLPYKEVFEFGKSYENISDIINKSQNILIDDLDDEEDDFRFGGIEMIESAIDWQRKRIIEIYTELVNNISSDKFEQLKLDAVTEEQKKERHYERLLEHCRDYLDWWKPYKDLFKPYHDDRNNPKLAGTWLYEHTFWDLIRIWKSFDPETEYFIFYGY